MFKHFAAIALVAGTLALPAIVVAPASAETIPTRDTLHAISCASNRADLYTVDADTAGLTLIGNSGLAGDCAGPAAFDPTTGTSYYLSWGDSGQLAVVNMTTGAATGTPITGDSTEYPDSLAIGLDGTAWIIGGAELYSVDLTTGVTTAITSLTQSCFYSFSVDPTTGKFYVIECSSGNAFELAVPSGTLTQIGTIALTGYTYALQIDTSGRWWFQEDTGIVGSSSLWSTPIPNDLVNPTTPESEGDFFESASETYPYSESLLLTYEPAAVAAPAAVVPVLAATGSEGAPVIIGAIALLMLGGGFTVAAARRRRRA